ncbi:hypothetical protein NQ317_005307 [Molorchus minor]|uniref:Chorion peroxidase n=1 Tax=Molorchus minor TaxID=1323400 RepID=A0ABQ9IY86_9CUCU|nr:hypothetical protein NQ317_005307 [Molorchus minor]
MSILRGELYGIIDRLVSATDGERGSPPFWLSLAIVQIHLAICIQFQHIELTGNGDNECALLLSGPPRSSHFDYTLNLLRGTQSEYNGPHTCITYDAVNAAYLDARKRIRKLKLTLKGSYNDLAATVGIAQPHGDWTAEDVATVGELLLDVSANLARTVVSRTMHPDENFHDHAGTVMVIAWGQFIDHDYTLQATPLEFKMLSTETTPRECCHRPPHLKHPYCDEIYIPEDDYFFRLFHVNCIDFVRTFPAVRPGCRLGSKVPYNTLQGKLRSGVGGLLRMNPAFDQYGLKDLLPLKLDVPDEGCTRPNASMYCFEAGEIRVNEQLVLTVMHTLMAREHNRVAKELAHINPHWDDETLFQEARRINIAIIQHITYNEFLPILLGKDVMEKFGLLLQKDDYWNGYDSSVNPGVIDAFAAAAYRFGHSLLPTAVERWSKAHKFIESRGTFFGVDLVSFNMQRGREYGLPGFMEFRKFCGLSTSHSFDDMVTAMNNETVRKYASIFDDPYDIDLWSGGVCERPLPGGMYELPNQPSSFSPDQLQEIRKARLARIICDNTDLIDTIQLYPMVLPDHELNPRVPCGSGIIPSIDLSKWAEFPEEIYTNSFKFNHFLGKK